MRIRLWDDSAPELQAAAAALGRINRFQGRLRVPNWTVLHHSYLAYQIAVVDFRERSDCAYTRDVYIYALIHDLPESLFGDVNGYLKPEALSILEERSHGMLCDSLGVPRPEGKVAKKVKELDRRCLNAEAHAFGDTNDNGVWRCAQDALAGDIEQAHAVRRVFYRPEHSMTPDGALVKAYVEELAGLLKQVKGKRL
jgi:hypothetical protein